ncbi:tyrosine recombinase XerC [Acuticoccus mangrovi]|uniref:Tyrosine recombinase XerC n=1 Tax=Acuticoccus mangrovi TaxID=2796142 RepID=A0A934MHI5_9HYPH|nr:tyrosine recombinase XerC [Acuticoccus mangrovi]MBJ3776111.1 tyrosine recombinase XerC [Acuticoccus mangrovi]
MTDHSASLLPADTAVLDARTAWLAGLAARGLSANTVAAYERDTRQFLAFLAVHQGGPARLADLDAMKPMDVRAFLAERRREGVEGRSLARILSGLRGFLNYLERHHGINAAAARAVAAPTKPRSLPRPVAPEAARTMVSAAEGGDWIAARDAAVLGLLYGCGLRVGEATGLDAAEMRPPVALLRIRGKGGKERVVPVLPAVAALIEAYRAAAPFALEEGAFFRGEKGGRLSPRIVQRAMAAWRGALGLPDSATPHALRHAFASHVLAGGGDLRAIQELLGHARLSTTQVYTAVDDSRLVAAWRDAHPRAGA